MQTRVSAMDYTLYYVYVLNNFRGKKLMQHRTGVTGNYKMSKETAYRKPNHQNEVKSTAKM